MAVSVNMRDMLEAGVHYGHQTRRWNPKMGTYIFGARNGIHIIDLQKTVKLFKRACDFLEETTSRNGHVLFVGTKRIARDIIRDEANRSGQYFINHRWLGGTLTNFQTIRQSIHRLKRLEKMEADGTLNQLTKKEALNLRREREKLERNIGGIKDMPGLPRAIFVADAHRETIAISEANILGIPVVALADTNADPTSIDYPIPANDDSLKSLQLFIRSVAEASLAGKMRRKEQGDTKAELAGITEGTFHDKQGHAVAVEKASGKPSVSSSDKKDKPSAEKQV